MGSKHTPKRWPVDLSVVQLAHVERQVRARAAYFAKLNAHLGHVHHRPDNSPIGRAADEVMFRMTKLLEAIAHEREVASQRPTELPGNDDQPY